MCKRVGNITEVPKCDVGAQAVGGLCYNSPAALCENIAFFPWGRGGLELMPDVTRWSPAVSA